jgi:hypothetical protein
LKTAGSPAGALSRPEKAKKQKKAAINREIDIFCEYTKPEQHLIPYFDVTSRTLE